MNEARDRWPRLLLNPVFAAVIPNAAGIIDHASYTGPQLAGHYCCFLLTSVLVWEGNRRIYFRVRRRYAWFVDSRRRLASLLATAVAFTGPVAALLIGGWAALTGDPRATPAAVAVAVGLIVLASATITLVYETAFVFRAWESDRSRAERLDRARRHAEQEILRREIDPHFLFNSLNGLLALIERDSALAMEFVENLADGCRYLLDTRSQPLVTLDRELEALDRFLALEHLRCGSCLELEVRVDPEVAARLVLPPLTLQGLLENAAKHNDVGPGAPLTVRIQSRGQLVIVSNATRPRTGPPPRSTRVGLANMAERFRLTLGTEPTWYEAGGRFWVELPLVAATDADTSRPG